MSWYLVHARNASSSRSDLFTPISAARMSHSYRSCYSDFVSDIHGAFGCKQLQS